jgi:uncharacterized cupredoxin-like copper-binding protein
MSATESPGHNAPVLEEEQARGERIEDRLARIEVQIDRGNREGRRAGRSFMIFATFALLIACASLLVVTIKLQAKPATVTRTVVRAPARSGTAAPQSVPASRVSVSLREFSVQPSSKVGRSGPITFHVRNAGKVMHEFVVIRTDKPAGSLLKGARADETGNVGETGDLQPGHAKTIRLDLKPGHYALICNLPGHYTAGQHTDFTVR